MYLPLSKHFPAAWSLPQNTAYFAFFPDFSHLFSDSDHFFRDPWVPLTLFPAATLVVYHIPMKIREKKQCFDSTLGKSAYKAFELMRSKVCLSHAGGLIRRKLFLKSVRRAIEIVQTKFLRWVLGVNKFCSPNACRSEVGRFPMRTKTKRRAIKFWLKFWEPEHQNKLSGIAFADLIGQDKKEL